MCGGSYLKSKRNEVEDFGKEQRGSNAVRVFVLVLVSTILAAIGTAIVAIFM